MNLEHILLVDDEEDIRTIGQLALAEVGGWRVTLAENGAAGLAAATAEPPDLIMLDVMMPEMDGPSTLAALRADPATADIPVIFMTAKVQKAEVDRYLGLGAAGVIPKPFDPMTLPDQVRTITAGL